MNDRIEQAAKEWLVELDEDIALEKVLRSEITDMNCYGAGYHDSAIRELTKGRDKVAELARHLSSNEWVKVTPETEIEEGFAYLVYGYDIDDPQKLPYQDILGYSYHGGWNQHLEKQTDMAVTHYMLLPAPPSAATQLGEEK